MGRLYRHCEAGDFSNAVKKLSSARDGFQVAGLYVLRSVFAPFATKKPKHKAAQRSTWCSFVSLRLGGETSRNTITATGFYGLTFSFGLVKSYLLSIWYFL